MIFGPPIHRPSLAEVLAGGGSFPDIVRSNPLADPVAADNAFALANVLASTRVRNVINSGDHRPTCSCEHWRAHCIQAAGAYACCPVVGCKERPTVGAHVVKVDSPDLNWYVVQMCTEHNNMRGHEFDLEPWARLTPTSPLLSCRKNF
jgi:hypothetical protein